MMFFKCNSFPPELAQNSNQMNYSITIFGEIKVKTIAGNNFTIKMPTFPSIFPLPASWGNEVREPSVEDLVEENIPECHY